VARGKRAYKSEKRSKELKRIKKQEAKRLRRLQKGSGPPLEGEEPVESEGTEEKELGEGGETPEIDSPETASGESPEEGSPDTEER